MDEVGAAPRPGRRIEKVIPGWARHYRRAWLGRDAIAGIVIWSVVVPQAVAYAQIAKLPPEAGLAAAPVALIAYALLGSSRTLVVSATTATSAVSAAAVGPLAHGDVARFAALSAAFALLVAVVLVAAGLLRIGGIADLVSKPVMTGFLFGLGLTITVGQLPKLLGVAGGSGTFFEQLWALLHQLGDIQGWTLGVGIASVAGLVALNRLRSNVPSTLVVLAGSILLSALLDFPSHGVDVVGKLPSAVPHPAWPDVSSGDWLDLLPAAAGVLLLTTEAVGVSRAIATMDGYQISPNRELVAIGGSNLLAGLSQGFVQSGGASQTMAAERAGGKSQLSTVIAALLILLTGAVLYPVFKDLPQATLGAIVIVAIASFFRVDELRRFARLRRSAILLSLTALAGVLALGVLPGLLVAAGLSLVLVIQRLSRPQVGMLARDPSTGVWGRADRHPGWDAPADLVVARADGPLFYGNAASVKGRLLSFVEERERKPKAVVLDLADNADLDVETLDAIGELAEALAAENVELRLASVRSRALAMLERAGLTERVRIEPTIDAAVSH